MAKLTEGYFRGEFLVSEAQAGLSREQITLISGQSVVPGEVLGQITSGGKYTAWDEDAADGSEGAVAIAHEAIDASAGDVLGWVVIRDAVVNNGDLTYSASADVGELAAAVVNMALTNLIVRTPA